MRALWESGRSAWPKLALTYDAFAAWLAPRLPAEQDPSALVGADLYLVAACLTQVPGAVEAFVEGPLAVAGRHADRIVKTPEARGELVQALVVQLLTAGADGAEPRLAQYSGRGALAVWLRMTVTRRALNTGRVKAKTVELEEAAFDREADHNPELSVLRRRHKDEISAIFREATLATSREDRTLLRLHYMEGSTLNELAALFKTSRSSMHRRIETVREQLMARIAELVRQRMRVSVSQQGSMLRIFQSDLRENLGQLLRDESAER
ncbi:MAG: sigma-70 family RNA polymerase sigma factor [Myxococcota bacterium]